MNPAAPVNSEQETLDMELLEKAIGCPRCIISVVGDHAGDHADKSDGHDDQRARDWISGVF